MKRLSLIGLMFLLVFTLLFPKEQLRIGVIYENENNAEFMGTVLRDELEKNFEDSDYEAEITREILIKSKEEFESELVSMEKDSEIDSIMVMGVISSELTYQKVKGYEKLVVAPFGINSKEREIPNLIYIYEYADILGGIRLLEELKEIKKISFVVPEFFNEGYLKSDLTSIVDEVIGEGYEAEIILAEDSMEKISSQLDETDLVYVFETDYKNVENILDMAREKKVMSFARIARGPSSNMVLMRYDNEPEIQRRIRAATVGMRRRVEGDLPSEIVTNLGKTEKVIEFNAKIAREIGVYPNLVLAQKLKFVNIEEDLGPELGFKEGIGMALNENTDLKFRKEDIITDEYNVKSAKAVRRPNLDVFAEYQRLDKDTAGEPITPAESSVRGGLSLSYLIFDDNVNANVSIRDYQRQATEARYEQEGLDTIQTFAESYLTILELNARKEVSKYNYELMREYLQIAQTKYEVGAAGPEDIYRFQSEISDALTNIVGVEGRIKIAEADLNRVLNKPMHSKYKLEEADAGSDAFRMLTKLLKESGQGIDGMRQYFIEEGVANAPEIKQIDARISAKERELKAAERERYLPKLSAFGEWSDDIKDDWGAGSDITSSDDRWNVGARVELPLYSGGDIEYSKQRARSELKSLEH